MSEKIPLCEACVGVYGECKYREQKDLEEFKSSWTCQGRVMAVRIVRPIIQEAFQKLKDARLLYWPGPNSPEDFISGNSTNAFLTYLEEHAGATIHYMPEGAKSSIKVKEDFDPVWIFKRKMEWQKNLPLYKDKVLRE